MAKAVFGHVEWEISEKWKLTMGGRYTQEDKDYHYVDWLYNYGVTEDLVDYRESETFGSFSGKVGLDYHTDNGHLVYASISRGFKSGGYPAGTTARLPEQVSSYDPEYLTAYELGFKFANDERTLRWEGAAFFYDYEDKQIAFAIPEQDYLQILTNLSETEIYGVETQVQWLPSESWFVQAGMSALQTEIVNPDPFDSAITGNQLPNSPEFTFNVLLNRDWQLESGSSVRLSMDYAWQSKNYFRVQNDTVQESYGVANGRLSWTSEDENTVVSLWGTNLTDEEYLIQSIPVFAYTADIYGKKRSFGVSLDYRW
jgi:iron complex outermembrane receptor protein